MALPLKNRIRIAEVHHYMRMKRTVSKAAFSLVEMMAGTAVMTLVITGGLVALGQATILSEKSTEQVRSDFILRQEVEALRSMDWSEIETLHDTILAYEKTRAGAYSELLNYSTSELTAMGITAEVTAKELHASEESGKTIFKINLSWDDKTGREYKEARVLTVTEGGLSAGS